MMAVQGFRIVVRNRKGWAALEQAMREQKKEPLRHRMAFRTLFTEQRSAGGVSFLFRSEGSSIIFQNHLGETMDRFSSVMVENGAVDGMDFRVEEVRR